MMMLKCIKQHLSNIWNSILEKVNQHWGWAEKSVANKKSAYLLRETLWASASCYREPASCYREPASCYREPGWKNQNCHN